MSKLKELLNALTKLEGINASIVVNRDGFVVEGDIRGKTTEMEYMAAIIREQLPMTTTIR